MLCILPHPAPSLERLSDFDTSHEVLVVGSALGGDGGEVCRRARALSPKLHIIKVPDRYSQEAHRDALALRRELDKRLGYAQRTAFAAMSSMGELGIVLDFLRNTCGEPVILSNLLLEAIEELLLRLGLTPEQEYRLMNAINLYTEKLVDFHKNNDNLIDSLEQVAELLAETERAIR